MAENEHEGTEQSTAKRRDQARERGQVPRSTDLNAAAVLLVSGGGLQLLGSYSGAHLRAMMGSGLALSRAQALDESLAVPTLIGSAAHAMLACAPIWGLTLLAAVAAPLALGGWNFSPQVLVPDFARLDPATGFGRMFSVRGAVELGKALLKFLLLAGVAALLLRQRSGVIAALGSQPLAQALPQAAGLVGRTLLVLAGVLGLIAAADVPWQLWQHARRLRMTRTEVREEMKESEGSPETKGRIRAIQRDLARRRMMAEVPKADVVVVNPTHYAVALRYDEARMRAPVVVAKGQDLVAARIRAIATEHRVPIFEAPPLARALNRYVEIGAEIPTSLYVAVAQVLTYLSQLRQAYHSGATPPPLPTIDASMVPEA